MPIRGMKGRYRPSVSAGDTARCVPTRCSLRRVRSRSKSLTRRACQKSTGEGSPGSAACSMLTYPAMSNDFVLSLEGCLLAETAGGRTSVVFASGAADLGALTDAERAAVARLCSAGARFADLSASLEQADGPRAHGRLAALIERLCRHGLICCGVHEGPRRLLTAVPMAPDQE